MTAAPHRPRTAPVEAACLPADAVPHLVWVAAPDGATEYLNRAFREYLGPPGTDWHTAVHSDDLPRAVALWEAAVRAGDEFRAEYRLRRCDGSYRWHLGRACPQREPDGAVTRWVGTCTDVQDQKAAEDAQRRSAAQFRALVEDSHEAFELLAADRTILYATPSVVRLGGRTAEELVGRRAFERCHPDDAPALLADYERLVREPGPPLNREYRYRHADGSWGWAELTCTNLLSNPAVGAVVANVRDVTARKSSEEALRTSDGQYRLLFEAIPHPVWVHDLETLRFLDVNAAAVARYGYSRDEFRAMTVADIRPSEEVPTLLGALRQPAAGRSDRLWRHRWKDGTTRVVEPHIHDIYYCGRAARLVLAEDVTERVAAERALREREELLRNVLAHIPCGVFWKDRHSVFLGCNEQFARDHGFAAPADVVGRTDAELPFERAEAAGFRACDRVVMETGEPVLHLEEAQTLPGGRRTVLTSKVPLRAAAGTVVGILGVYQDITALKRLEEEYRQAQKMEAVGRLAGGVAHDFNNLLTVINGFGDLALAQLSGSDPVRALLEEVRKAGERAAGLTGQLLAFGRKQILRHEVLDPNAVVAELAAMLRRLIGEDIDLVVRPGAGLLSVRADRGQVEQVLLNLAVNARDAMPTGGTLTIETRNVTLPGKRADDGSEVRPGPHVLVAVSDTGCGMTEEVKAHVFEPFFTTKGLGKGTGLGLATVYGIVKQSGGHVEVEAAPGRGATFRIYLPVDSGPPARERPDPVAGALPGGTETVLVTEDEGGVRGLAVRTLRQLGYTVLAAAGADEAAVAAGGGRPIDLLVTDVVMPGDGGRELAARLRVGRPGLRVLYMSGYTDDALLRHGVEHGGANFLQKPFTPTALAHKVREVLDRGS
jgi:PAS domain S-box-containing protein